MLLISATGIPLGIWSKFLDDPTHGFRIMVVESGSGDLLKGGIQSDSDLTVDAAKIAAALDAESLEVIDVVAWCNGGRVAVHLADRFPGRIKSLVMLSATLRGIQGVPPRPTTFEDNLYQIFRTVAQKPALAPIFVKTLIHQSEALDWDRFADDPAARVGALFGLPSKEQALDLLAPMSQPDYLLKYGRRAVFDEAFPIHEALANLKLPLMLITGDHDNRVDNAFTCDVLRAFGLSAVHASIKGGGHYVQDLQYSYFRSLLIDFVKNKRRPAGAARLGVELLDRPVPQFDG